jgi:hypothetical protein
LPAVGGFDLILQDHFLPLLEPFVTHGRINHRHGAGDAQRQEVPE